MLTCSRVILLALFFTFFPQLEESTSDKIWEKADRPHHWLWRFGRVGLVLVRGSREMLGVVCGPGEVVRREARERENIPLGL